MLFTKDECPKAQAAFDKYEADLEAQSYGYQSAEHKRADEALADEAHYRAAMAAIDADEPPF